MTVVPAGTGTGPRPGSATTPGTGVTTFALYCVPERDHSNWIGPWGVGTSRPAAGNAPAPGAATPAQAGTQSPKKK